MDGRRRTDILVWAALVLFSVVLQLHEAAARTLWGDELFSLRVADRGWIDLVRAAVRDVVHPPLFYILLKIWISIGGERPVWLRSLPVLFSVLSLIPTVLLSWALGLSRKAFRLSLLLIACSGFLVRYGHELRMYSLLQLLSMTSLYLFVRFLRAARPSVAEFAALTVVNVAMVYTHYYGWILLGCEGLFLLLARRSKLVAFLAGTLPVVIAFAPWLWLVRRRTVHIGGLGTNLAGLSRPGWDDLLKYFTGLIGPSPDLVGGGWLPGFLILTVPLLLALTVVFGRSASDPEPSERLAVGFLALFSFVPLAVAMTASQALPQPIFTPRYLIIASVPFLLLCGIVLDRLRPPILRTILITLVAGWSILGTAEPFASPDRIAWGDLVHLMLTRGPNSAALSGNVPIYVLGPGNRRPILYYLKREKAQGFEIRLVDDVSEIPADAAWVASRSVQRDQSSSGRVRYLGGMGLAEMQLSLLDRGFQVGCVFQSGRPPDEGYLISIRRTVSERKTTD